MLDRSIDRVVREPKISKKVLKILADDLDLPPIVESTIDDQLVIAGEECLLIERTLGQGRISPSDYTPPSYDEMVEVVGEDTYDWMSGVVLDWEGLSFPEALEAAAAGIFDSDRNSERRAAKEALRRRVACESAGADPPEELTWGRRIGACRPNCHCLNFPSDPLHGLDHQGRFEAELDRLHLECDTVTVTTKLKLPYWKLVCSRCERPEYGAFVFYFLAHGVRFMSEEGMRVVPKTRSKNVGLDSPEDIARLEAALVDQVDQGKASWWGPELASALGMEFTTKPPLILMCFMVEHNGKYRLVNNGSAPRGQSLNEHCPDTLVRYVNIKDIIRMFQAAHASLSDGERLAGWKIDMRDMFRQLGLHPLQIPLCGFETPSGRVGVLIRMPMGVKPSCFFANAFSGIILEEHRRNGHIAERITDDFFGIDEEGNAGLAYKALEKLLVEGGVELSYGLGKSTGGAVHVVDMKGVDMNTDSLKAERMKRKQTELDEALDQALSSRRRTKKKLLRLGGLCAQEVELSAAGRTWLRDLFGPTLGVEKMHMHCNTGPTAPRFNAACRVFKRLIRSPGRDILEPLYEGTISPVHLQFDAAGESSVAGMFFNGEAILIPMSEKYTIGPKELRTVLKGMRLIAPLLRNMTVIVGTDSTNTRDWINNRTAKNRPEISLQMLQELFDLCGNYSIDLHASRIPTKWNVISDGLSRWGTPGALEQVAEGVREWGEYFETLDLPGIDWERAAQLGTLSEPFSG